MNVVRNSFAPGAGNLPTGIAGRQAIFEDCHIALERTLLRKAARLARWLASGGITVHKIEA